MEAHMKLTAVISLEVSCSYSYSLVLLWIKDRIQGAVEGELPHHNTAAGGVFVLAAENRTDHHMGAS